MVYELRTYIIPEGRMPDILNRFETITFKLFERHGIEVIGFWTHSDANELVYLCKYESEAAIDKAWNTFSVPIPNGFKLGNGRKPTVLLSRKLSHIPSSPPLSHRCNN